MFTFILKSASFLEGVPSGLCWEGSFKALFSELQEWGSVLHFASDILVSFSISPYFSHPKGGEHIISSF